MQVRTADIADQQRVAAEHEPRLLAATPPIGDRVRMMRGRVPRRRDRLDERVAELDHLAVPERLVLERDASTRWQVRGRSGPLDERR